MLYQNFRLFVQARICPSVKGQTYRCLYVYQKLREAEKRKTQPDKIVQSTSKNDQVGVSLGAKGILSQIENNEE
jgi:hypothetical protein